MISDIPSLKTLTYPTRKMAGTTALSAIQLLYKKYPPHNVIVNTVNGNTGLYYLTISFSQPQLQMLLISMLTCPNPGTRRSTLQKDIAIIHYLTLQNHMKRLLIYVAMSCSEGISCSLPCPTEAVHIISITQVNQTRQGLWLIHFVVNSLSPLEVVLNYE